VVRGVGIGYVYGSSIGGDPRPDLNPPAAAQHVSEGGKSAAGALKFVDAIFPNVSPARRAIIHRFARYGSVSAISTATNVVVLGVLIGIVGYPAVLSTIIATAVGTVPSFELNRRWVWAHSGGFVLRKAIPYVLLSFTGLILATLAVHFAAGATSHSSRLVHTAAVEVADVGSYGALWLLQFVLCDRILFRHRAASPADGPRHSAAQGPDVPSHVYVAAGAEPVPAGAQLV
jgi:putative flippase GtrA